MKSTRVSTDNNNHNRNKQAAENDLPGAGERGKLAGKLHPVYGKDAKERKERVRGDEETERRKEEMTRRKYDIKIRVAL